MRSSTSMHVLATATGDDDGGGAATQKQKPCRIISAMRDDKFRPIVRTLADALDQMANAGKKQIRSIRGGSSRLIDWGGSVGALTWIQGETEDEFIRVGIPVSKWFFGWDQNNCTHKHPITLFNGKTILEDGSLRLKQNLWIRRVGFEMPRLNFILTDVQKSIAALVSEYLNLSGHDFPTGHIDYGGLSSVEVTLLKPVADYVRSRWQQEGLTSPPPSGETIAGTLEALGMRRRDRLKH